MPYTVTVTFDTRIVVFDNINLVKKEQKSIGNKNQLIYIERVLLCTKW